MSVCQLFIFWHNTNNQICDQLIDTWDEMESSIQGVYNSNAQFFCFNFDSDLRKGNVMIDQQNDHDHEASVPIEFLLMDRDKPFCASRP